MSQLLEAGTNIVRLNFARGDFRVSFSFKLPLLDDPNLPENVTDDDHFASNAQENLLAEERKACCDGRY